MAVIRFSTSLFSQLLFTLGCFTIEDGKRPAMPIRSRQNCNIASLYQVPTKNTNKPPNAWQGLVPLQSSRADVERVLGKPKWSRGASSFYETECGNVDVLYSKGICELSGVERWKVPADVVIKVQISPRSKLQIEDLKLQLDRYTRYKESHPESWVRYRSADDGIRVLAIADDKGETVLTVSYEPRVKDKALQCANEE